MSMFPFIVSWGVLATVVLVLAIYRRNVARKEDDMLHVDSSHAEQQIAVAKKLEGIDRWGKILTVLAVVYALVLLGLFLYNGWQQSSVSTF